MPAFCHWVNQEVFAKRRLSRVSKRRAETVRTSLRGKSAIAQQEIEQGQKHVIACVGSVMMAHVVSTRKAQTPGQPSLHVNTPMHLLGSYQINRPTHEDARRKSKPQQQVDHDHQDSIAGE